MIVAVRTILTAPDSHKLTFPEFEIVVSFEIDHFPRLFTPSTAAALSDREGIYSIRNQRRNGQSFTALACISISVFCEFASPTAGQSQDSPRPVNSARHARERGKAGKHNGMQQREQQIIGYEVLQAAVAVTRIPYQSTRQQEPSSWCSLRRS